VRRQYASAAAKLAGNFLHIRLHRIGNNSMAPTMDARQDDCVHSRLAASRMLCEVKTSSCNATAGMPGWALQADIWYAHAKASSHPFIDPLETSTAAANMTAAP
jgi:hypothetical protein